MSIDEAIAALEAGREEDALDALLRAWKPAPAPALAAAIEALGAKLDAKRTRPTGKTVKDKEAKWHALVADGKAADIGVLLATLADVAKAAPLEARIAKLADRPADPRIAMKLATMCESWPIPGSTGIPSLARALELIVEIGDPRTRTVLEQTQRQVTNDTRHMTRWFLHGNLERYIAAMRAKVRELPPPPGVERVMELVRAEFTPAMVTTADAGALFAAVYANPDDDGARSVLADWLQQQGDPRGELIALQLVPAGVPGAKARKSRETELLRSHGREWLGLLEPAVQKSGMKYERGFLAKCSLKEPSAGAGERMLEAPEWATITELDCGSWLAPAARAAKLMPALRSVTGLRSFLPSHPVLARATFEYLTDRDVEHLLAVESPRLRSLTIGKSFMTLEQFAPFWSSAVAKQLEQFSVNCWSIDDWLPDLHARVAPRGHLERVSVSMRDHSPWSFTFESRRHAHVRSPVVVLGTIALPRRARRAARAARAADGHEGRARLRGGSHAAPDRGDGEVRSVVELGIAAEDAPLVERDAARRREVGREARALGDPIAQREELRDVLRGERLRERVAQAFDDLERGEVGVRDTVTDDKSAVARLVVAEEVLEVAEELGQPRRRERTSRAARPAASGSRRLRRR